MEWIFNDWFEYKDELYFFHALERYSGKYNIKENKFYFVPEIEGTDVIEWGIDKFFVSEKYAFGVLLNGKGVLKIDMESMKLSIISIEAEISERGVYACHAFYNDSIYLFLLDKSEVIILNNVSTDGVTTENILLDKAYYIGCNQRDKVWLFPENGNDCICFDLLEKKYQNIQFDTQFEMLLNADCTENGVFVVSRSGQLYSFDPALHKFELSVKLPVDACYHICVADEKIVFLPCYMDKFYTFDINNGSLSDYGDIPSDIVYNAPKEWVRYYRYASRGGRKFYALRSADYILVIDEKSGEISWIKPSGTDASSEIAYFTINGGITRENADANAKSLIQYLCS